MYFINLIANLEHKQIAVYPQVQFPHHLLTPSHPIQKESLSAPPFASIALQICLAGLTTFVSQHTYLWKCSFLHLLKVTNLTSLILQSPSNAYHQYRLNTYILNNIKERWENTESHGQGEPQSPNKERGPSDKICRLFHPFSPSKSVTLDWFTLFIVKHW